MRADTLAHAILLGTATGEHEVQPRVALARRHKRLGQQLGALLAGDPSRIQDVHR